MIRFFNHLKLNFSEREFSRLFLARRPHRAFPSSEIQNTSLASVAFFSRIHINLNSITRRPRRVSFTQNLSVLTQLNRVSNAHSDERIIRRIESLDRSEIMAREIFRGFGRTWISDTWLKSSQITQNPELPPIRALKSDEIRGLSTRIELIVSAVTVSSRVSVPPPPAINFPSLSATDIFPGSTLLGCRNWTPGGTLFEEHSGRVSWLR